VITIAYNKDFEEADFNLAAGTIYRINNLLIYVDYYFQTNDYVNAFKTLQNLYSNVFPFLKKDEKEKEDKEEERLEKEITKQYTHLRNRNSFYPNTEIDDDLRIWDRQLRQYLMKYKLYMKMIDSRLPAARVG